MDVNFHICRPLAWDMILVMIVAVIRDRHAAMFLAERQNPLSAIILIVEDINLQPSRDLSFNIDC